MLTPKHYRGMGRNGQVVLGYVGEEVVESGSLPLPQILAGNPDGKRNG